MKQSHIPSKESMQERRLNLQQGPFTSLKTSSLQIHHIKQCSTSLHKSILQCRLNLPCQVSNNSITFMWHNSVNSKQTKHQRPQLKCNGAMKKKMIHRLPTPLTHITPVKNNNRPLQKLSVVRILPKEADHEKKATLGGTFNCHTTLQGKEGRVGGQKER